MESLSWKDIVTVALAAVGAVLGLLNTWNALNQRRVRLVVRPLFAHPINGGPPMFSVEVTNLSGFAVTITEVGFSPWRGAEHGRRSAVVTPIILDGKPWPRRLEPRSAVSGFLDPRRLEPDPSQFSKAYAKTECGVFAYGRSPALRMLRRMAGEIGREPV